MLGITKVPSFCSLGSFIRYGYTTVNLIIHLLKTIVKNGGFHFLTIAHNAAIKIVQVFVGQIAKSEFSFSRND